MQKRCYLTVISKILFRKLENKQMDEMCSENQLRP